MLCSIETDKATVDFEMQEEGYLAKTFYEAGTKNIPLGKVLAILAENKDDVPAFKDFVAEGGAAPAKKEAPPKQAEAPAATPAAPVTTHAA